MFDKEFSRLALHAVAELEYVQDSGN